MLLSHFTPSSAQKVLEADSVHVYLLTCSPHQQVYSLYGHTALRIEDRQRGTDWAVNYGVFDFRKSFFVLRFVFGLTDYEIGIYPFSVFIQEYVRCGSGVVQQELNLTPEEKLRVLAAIDENYRPENRVYRYNYFHDNCTSRAMDIVTENIDGRVVYNDMVDDGMTFRKLIHQMNGDHPWARLGNDLLLGMGADRQLDQREKHFLPHMMQEAADSAVIIASDNSRRPLVKASSQVLRVGTQVVEEEFPLTPVQCAVLLLFVSCTVTFVEWRRKRYLWVWDAVQLTLAGVCGIILTAMIFSQHPTVSVNAQLLLFNPLPLLFGVQAIRRCRRGQMHWLWMVEMLLACLLFVCFSFGIQWIDMSVRIVALSLLVRYCANVQRCHPMVHKIS